MKYRLKKNIFNRNDLTYMIIACIELQDFLNWNIVHKFMVSCMLDF